MGKNNFGIAVAACGTVLLLSGMAAGVDAPVQETGRQIRLHLIATDRSGHPVTDLQANDLRVLDDSKQQTVKLVAPAEPRKPEPMIVLLDTLDFGVSQRVDMAMWLKEGMAKLPSDTPVYIYLLTPDATITPVIPVTTKLGSLTQSDVSTRLDNALNQIQAPKRTDLASYPSNTFKAKEAALFELARDIVPLPGRKQVIWISYGISSSLRIGEDWTDMGPRLRSDAARFNHADISIYTVYPALGASTKASEGLDIIAASTGARSFNTKDMTMVLNQVRTDGMASYMLEYPESATTKGQKLDLHKVKVSCERKGVHIYVPQVYLALDSK